ncbi:MAG: dTMP kinase [Candidatus Muiribacteriota bacterium]
MFITFEGPEGSGKSTQIDLLTSKLKNLKKKYIRTFEPGGTPFGKGVRKILLDSEKMCERAELFLYAADRAEHVRKVIQPALHRGDIVISDRYYHSTIAYQGYGRGIELELIYNIMNLAIDNVEPDLIFLIDLKVDEGLKRIAGSGREKDRIEKEHIDFHEKIRNGYLEIAGKFSDKFIKVDGSGNQEDIHNIIWEEVKNACKF